ncbi:hypothetical protein Ancab_018455 [Ancistrocladus abbreviatus]
MVMRTQERGAQGFDGSDYLRSFSIVRMPRDFLLQAEKFMEAQKWSRGRSCSVDFTDHILLTAMGIGTMPTPLVTGYRAFRCDFWRLSNKMMGSYAR